MGKSQRIRLSDVRAVHALVEECLELWADPVEWRHHLTDGITRIAQITLSSCEHRRLSPRDPQGLVVGRASRGWPDERTRREFHDALDGEPGSYGMPNFEIAVQHLIEKGKIVVWRGDVVDARDWHKSMFFQGVFEPAGVADGMVLLRWDPRPGHFMHISANRFRGDRKFQPRDRRILNYIHDEIMPLVGTRLALEGQRSMVGLTPRRREALDWLLAGLSEKEIATRMGISQATAHQYVGELYEHFDVNSRAELMAYFVHRRPG